MIGDKFEKCPISVHGSFGVRHVFPPRVSCVVAANSMTLERGGIVTLKEGRSRLHNRSTRATLLLLEWY